MAATQQDEKAALDVEAGNGEKTASGNSPPESDSPAPLTPRRSKRKMAGGQQRSKSKRKLKKGAPNSSPSAEQLVKKSESALSIESTNKSTDGGPTKAEQQNVSFAAVSDDENTRLFENVWLRMVYFAADGWLAYMGWTVAYGFLWSLFYHELDPTAKTVNYVIPAIFFILMIAAPFSLDIPQVMLAIDRNADFLLLVQPVSFLFSLVPVAWVRTCFLSIGAVSFYCYAGLMYSRPDTDYRQQSFRYAHIMGLLCMVVVSWNQASINPVFNSTLWGVAVVIGFTGAIGAGVIIFVERYVVDQSKSALAHHADLDYSKPSRTEVSYIKCTNVTSAWYILTGMSYAAVLFLTIWVFTSAEALARWSGQNPLEMGPVLILFFLLGYFALTKFITMADEFESKAAEFSIPTRQFAFTYFFFILGTPLVLYTDNAGSMAGSTFITFAMPVLWWHVMHDFTFLRHERTVGKALGVGAVFYFFLSFWDVGIIFGGDTPLMGVFRGKTESLFWLCVLLALLAPSITHLRQELGWLRFHRMPPNRERLLSWKSWGPSLFIVIGIFLSPWIIIRHVENAKAAPPRPDELRVATINVLRGYQMNGQINVDNIWSAISDNEMSFVGLQESDGINPAYGNRDIVGYNSYFLDCYEFYGLNPKKVSFGVSFLSYYKMRHSSVEILPEISGCGECPLPHRVLIATTISFNGVDVRIFNMQAEAFSVAAALPQIQRLADVVNATAGALIVMGDFQFGPDSPAMDPLYELVRTGRLKIASNSQSVTSPPNYNNPARNYRNASFYPYTERVDRLHRDYIFYRNLNLVSFDVLFSVNDISNHFPVMAVFRTL